MNGTWYKMKIKILTCSLRRKKKYLEKMALSLIYKKKFCDVVLFKKIMKEVYMDEYCPRNEKGVTGG